MRILCSTKQLQYNTAGTPNALDINSVNHNTLVPGILHDASDLMRSLLADHNAHQVQAGVNTRRDAARRDDSQSTESQQGSASVALPSHVALLPRITALATHGRPSGIRLATHVWILLWVAQIEAQVIDDVSLLDEIASLGQIALGDLAVELLEFGAPVGMCCGGEARQDALLSEEHAAGADAHECALLLGVLLLEVGEGLDEAEGLGFGFDDGFDTAARDDEDVEFGEALESTLEVEVGAEGGSLGADGVFFLGGENSFEGLGGWWRRGNQSGVCAVRMMCNNGSLRVGAGGRA